jgi:hypothetical protein
VPEKVADKITFRAHVFALQDVRLLDGPFKQAMTLDQEYLLGLDPDRLLHNFRVNAGLPSSAKPLGGWEAPDVELRGHTAGHYLSALALMYAATGDARFKTRGDLMVTELGKIQDAEATKFHAGYLSAFPEEFFDRVDARQRVWAPYYTIHKIMAGLLDMHELCGNAQALAMVTKMADWVKFRVDRLSEDQQQRALGTEFGGIEEAHALQSENASDGYFEGKRTREARGGWFSYQVKVAPDRPVTLVCAYRGSEGRRRVFDILVDGEKIATETLEYHPTEQLDKEYAIPESLTRGKERVTVKFQAHQDTTAGALIDVRTIAGR